MAAIRGMMERMRNQGGVYWEGVLLIWEQQIEQQQKNTKIKYNEGLRWPPFDIFSRNNQPKTHKCDGGGIE
jgi:hypothetical protein